MPNSNTSEDQDTTMFDDSSSITSGPSTQPQLPSQPTVKGNSSARLAAPENTQKGLNANGKRTLAAVLPEMAAANGNNNNGSIPVLDMSVQHGPETVPGASWKSQKAQMEISKAMDMIVDKELMIGAKYGDVLDRGNGLRRKS